MKNLLILGLSIAILASSTIGAFAVSDPPNKQDSAILTLSIKRYWHFEKQYNSLLDEYRELKAKVRLCTKYACIVQSYIENIESIITSLNDNDCEEDYQMFPEDYERQLKIYRSKLEDLKGIML